MRLPIYIMTLLFTTTVFGQIKDHRAELEIRGLVNEISVSSDEKIWLISAAGNTYYANNIDSNWHYWKPLFEPSDEFDVNNPNICHISFFNKDTAIMTGYISVSKKEYKRNGYYLTTDGGKTCKLLDYGGNTWIYDIFVDEQGNAWMGGSSGEIFFSKDYGQHWVKLNSPFNSSSRINCIFMIDSITGISGALQNEIYTTSDNWKSNKEVATPYNQKMYINNSGDSDDRIVKILIWKNHIVVNQNGNIYYTENNKIDWKSFPTKICDFELDNDSKTLFAITDSLKIISFSSPTEFQLVTSKQLSSYPIDIKVVNNSLFIISNGYDVYKVNINGLTKVKPYTTDKKIAEPHIVKQGTKLIWGANGNHIYLADDNQRDWYRENVFDFRISDFILVSDSTVILWDGIQNNYLYSLKDHTPKIYFPESPLKTFLAPNLQTFSINSGSQGCFHSVNNEVNYEKISDSTFETKTFSINNYQDKTPSAFNNSVKINDLLKVLKCINTKPSAVPSLKDFQITEKDKKNYLALVDEQLKSKKIDDSNGKKKINKVFYYSVLSMLDTLNDSIITTILNHRDGIWSTTNNWFAIQIVNESNDTLNISRNYYVSTLPWNLPWKFEYKGMKFNCYNIELSKFISSCIPINFMYKDVFDNRILIMQIADYLWNKKD